MVHTSYHIIHDASINDDLYIHSKQSDSVILSKCFQGPDPTIDQLLDDNELVDYIIIEIDINFNPITYALVARTEPMFEHIYNLISDLGFLKVLVANVCFIADISHLISHTTDTWCSWHWRRF